MRTNTNRHKTVKKSAAFWKHGKHKGALVRAIQLNKADAERGKPQERQYSSVIEALRKEK